MSFLDNAGLSKYTEKIKTLLNGFVPKTTTINGVPLDRHISLSAGDVNALSTGGGRIWGDLRLQTTANYGTKINFGDGDFVHITEASDNCLEIKADRVNFVLSDTTDTKFTVNGEDPFGSASTDLSLYATKESPDFTGSISMGRKADTAIGRQSVAIGTNCTASQYFAHAEGNTTTASAPSTHAEGAYTTASGTYSHSEGYQTKAMSDNSHAEGNGTSVPSSGIGGHAEGRSTKAESPYSHAEGSYTVTSSDGWYAHAEGASTITANFASHVSGKYNKAMTGGGRVDNIVGDVFVVGNGTEEEKRSNALRLDYSGQLYLTKSYMSSGADYAEYFEWLDGNPDAEDRVGHFVTLDGDKIRYAEPGDYVLGVVSGQPCIIGNADEDWLGRWIHDDFNRFVKEYLLMHEVEVTPPEGATKEELQVWRLDNCIEERDGHYFKMEEEIVDYPTPHWRHKANPSYDATQAYIERQDRKEWDAVGMVGVLSVVDDGSCVVNGYCKVSSNGIAAKAESYVPRETFRVISRVTENIIKILLL